MSEVIKIIKTSYVENRNSRPNRADFPHTNAKRGRSPADCADHGMLTYTRDGDEVSYTGYVPGYFRQEVEALKRLSGEPSGS